MEKIIREFYVKSLASEPPFVRIGGYFLEGGTPYRNAHQNKFSFLAGSLNLPDIEDRLTITIEVSK